MGEQYSFSRFAHRDSIMTTFSARTQWVSTRRDRRTVTRKVQSSKITIIPAIATIFIFVAVAVVGFRFAVIGVILFGMLIVIGLLFVIAIIIIIPTIQLRVVSIFISQQEAADASLAVASWVRSRFWGLLTLHDR